MLLCFLWMLIFRKVKKPQGIQVFLAFPAFLLLKVLKCKSAKVQKWHSVCIWCSVHIQVQILKFPNWNKSASHDPDFCTRPSDWRRIPFLFYFLFILSFILIFHFIYYLLFYFILIFLVSCTRPQTPPVPYGRACWVVV